MVGLSLANMRLVQAPEGSSYPIHVVALNQSTIPGVTHAIEDMKGDHLATKTVARRTRGVLEVFDHLLGKGIEPTAAPATILAGVRGWLLTIGVRTPVASSGPWREATGADAAMHRGREALAGLKRAYASMCDAGLYLYGHPLEMSEEQMRLQRLRARESGRKRGRRASLSSALIRFGRVGYKPPRRTLVECVRDVVARAEAAGWSEGEILYLRILVDGGCRPSDPTRFLVRDWFDAERCAASCLSTSKGHGDARVKTVRWSDATQAALTAWVDGRRREQVEGGLTVAEYIAVGDADEPDFLDEPLLVDGAGRPLDYDRLARRFRRDIADHSLDPRTGKALAARPTLHWLRHLFVYDNLAIIERIADASTREREKDDLVAYLFWSTGRAMLSTYGREFAEARVAASMTESMRRREEMAAAIRDGRAHPATMPARPAGAPAAISRMFRDRRLDPVAPVAAEGR